MLTLYHAPRSRASRIVALIEELGARAKVQIVSAQIRRLDGSISTGAPNPHPEGKVPLLVHDGVEIWESTAIALYLTELFPEAGLGRPVGSPDRGRLLSWLAWYGDVLEPVVVHAFAGLEHPVLHVTFRGLPEAIARLDAALAEQPYLMGAEYSVADLIVASTFLFAPQFVPEDGPIRAWVDRCAARPAQRAMADYEAGLEAA